jgi:hypothetical protein
MPTIERLISPRHWHPYKTNHQGLARSPDPARVSINFVRPEGLVSFA